MKRLVNLRYFTVGAAVAIIHLVTGLTLWLGNATYALHTTPINFISNIFGNSPITVGSVMIITALLALIPFLSDRPRRGALIALIFPQQILLFLHLFSIIAALISGHYPDGYVPQGGSVFIFIDQLWLLTVIFWHSMEYWATLAWAKKEEIRVAKAD